MRVTATDSESLLRALVPHYEGANGFALPVGRHGMGLLSLQTFVLLLEVGRERRRQGKPFLFAMEEPELHIPPGIQRRLLAQAVSIAHQSICTSHSPRLAACYAAASVQFLDHRPPDVVSTPLLAQPLETDASSATRKLCHDDRPRFIEALMHHRVLIPEGRSEYEWFQLLADMLETGDFALVVDDSDIPSFGTVLGVVPTHNSAVTETFSRLRRLRSHLVPLVDGDRAGNEKVEELLTVEDTPETILQWQDGWAIEDAIGWILRGDEHSALKDLSGRIDQDFTSIDKLVDLFKVKKGPGRLKTDYLAYEEVVSVIGSQTGCRKRAAVLLETLTKACLGLYEDCIQIKRDDDRSTDQCVVLRLFM